MKLFCFLSVLHWYPLPGHSLWSLQRNTFLSQGCFGIELEMLLNHWSPLLLSQNQSHMTLEILFIFLVNVVLLFWIWVLDTVLSDKALEQIGPCAHWLSIIHSLSFHHFGTCCFGRCQVLCWVLEIQRGNIQSVLKNLSLWETCPLVSYGLPFSHLLIIFTLQSPDSFPFIYLFLDSHWHQLSFSPSYACFSINSPRPKFYWIWIFKGELGRLCFSKGFPCFIPWFGCWFHGYIHSSRITELLT